MRVAIVQRVLPTLLVGVILLVMAPSGLRASARTASAAKQPPTLTARGDSEATSTPMAVLDVLYKVIMCIVGISGFGASVWFCAKYFKSIKGLAADAKELIEEIKPDLPCYRKMATRINRTMENIVPTALRGLERLKAVKDGTEAEFIRIISADYAKAESPTELSDSGLDLLERSKMHKIIDAHQEQLIKNLEEQKLKTALDVETKSLCLLRRLEDEKVVNYLKNYLYQNPDKNLNSILFVGSIYLRDKYLEKHPELKEALQADFV